MQQQNNPAIVSPTTTEEMLYQAALANALAAKPDMTQDEQDLFRREYERAQHPETAAAPAAPANSPNNNTPAPTTPTPTATSRAMGKIANALPATLGDALRKSADLYKNNKAVRYTALAATAGLWAWPVLSAMAAKKLYTVGPGKILGGAFGGAKNTLVGGSMVASMLIGKTIKYGVVALLAVAGGKALIDISQDRASPLDAVVNGLSSTFNTVLKKGGEVSQVLLPKAETAYGVAEGLAVSGANSVGDVVSSGVDKTGNAASSAKSSLSECVDKGEDCGKAIGNTALNTSGNLIAGAFNVYTDMWAWTIDKFYFSAVPAVGKFAWDNTACKMFNCAADKTTSTPAESAKTPEKSVQIKPRAEKAHRVDEGKPSPSTVNPLASLGYVDVGSRYVSICTLRAMDTTGKFLPGMEKLTHDRTLDKHLIKVGEKIEAMKSDLNSPLARAVTTNKAYNVTIIAPAFNEGATTPIIDSHQHRLSIKPDPVDINGVAIPYMCRELPMDTFLKGKGISIQSMSEKPTRVLQ